MALHFQGFNSHGPVRIYHRHLPHWRQDGATYFVTCRLADSLPDHLVRQLEQLRQTLLARQGDTAGYLEADRAYFQAMKHHLAEGHGACWLKRPDVADMIGAAYRHFDGARYELGQLCVMPNHTHVLVRPTGEVELEEILHSWKSFTAKRINAVVGREGSVWQEESYDRLVRDRVELARIERYVRNNLLPLAKRDPGW